MYGESFGFCFFFGSQTGKRRANATASVSRVLDTANSGDCHRGDQVFSFAPYAPQNYMEDKDLWQFGRVSDRLTHAYSLADVPPRHITALLLAAAWPALVLCSVRS